MKTGIESIAQERKEQIEKHGRTVAHDKRYNTKRQLRSAAYMLIADDAYIREAPDGWHSYEWRKMASKSVRERLIIAGALIAAELDRLNQEL